MSSLSRHRKRLINAVFAMPPRHSSCLVVLVDMTVFLLIYTTNLIFVLCSDLLKKMEQHKFIIISAPSGSGKSTIIHYLLQQNLGLEFSVSATTREPRGEEKDGIDYHFVSVDEFKSMIDHNELLEYEEVYPGRYYGTPKSEIKRIACQGKTPIFDLDVLGGVHVKQIFGDQALALFIQPPSIEELRNRLIIRGTETPEKIDERVARSAWELTFASKFDVVVVNDDIENAKAETIQIILDFLKK